MPSPAGLPAAAALPRRLGEMAERRCCSRQPLPERRRAVAICGGVGLRFAGQGIANGDDGIARDGGSLWLNDDGGDSPLAARGTKRGGHGEWPKRRMSRNGKNVLLEVSFLQVLIESLRVAESRDSAHRRIWPGRAGKGGRGGRKGPSLLANGEGRRVAKACGTRGFARGTKKPPGGVREASWILAGARNRIRTCDLYRVKIAF